MEEKEQLNWLSMAPYSRRQVALQDKRTDDTGIWLLDSKEYNHWKVNPGDILWLRGISKSFNVSEVFHITNYMQQWAVANRFFGMTFFFLREDDSN